MNATLTLIASLVVAVTAHAAPHTRTFVVTASDGTQTINVITPGHPVTGTVILPDGSRFSF